MWSLVADLKNVLSAPVVTKRFDQVYLTVLFSLEILISLSVKETVP